MEPETGTLRSRDGTELALYRWRLAEPRATCLLVHGYAEHLGRYAALADALSSGGLEVWGVDLRGHGRSPGPRADVRRFGDFVEDVAGLSDRLQEERRGLPRAVLGHSMGATIALRFALEHAGSLDALVLSAPFLRPTRAPPSWLTGVAAGLARTLPQLPLQPFDAGQLARDPAVGQAYRSDPLTYSGWLKARMGHELVSSGAVLARQAPALDVPTLVLHGGADAIADPAASAELVRAASQCDVTLKTYPESYHEVFNDLDRDRAVSDVLGWFDAHLPAGGPG